MAIHNWLWKGKPITDLEQFCKEQKCDLVTIKVTEKERSLQGGYLVVSEDIEEWPSVFLDNLHISSPRIVTIEELKRRSFSEG